jgi:hypothetical protein
MTEVTEAFNRGYESGKVNTRLDGHDAQLTTMTSTLTKVVDVEAQLTLAVQALGRDASARDEKAIALALALKDAEVERRNKDSATWSPFARTITALAALTGIGVLILTWVRG